MFLRRTVPLAICFVMGVAMALQYYVPHALSDFVFAEFSTRWLIIITGFALILGMASVCQVHYRHIRRRQAGWGYSVVMYVGMVVMIAAGIISGGVPQLETEAGPVQLPFGWMYEYTMVPLQATMFSILAFFIASAAFRAFRIRSVNAALLLAAGVIVMFGQVTLGEYLGRLVGLNPGQIVLWIMLFPNTAAQRAILIGVALGMIATSLKIIFGLERAYLGGGE